MSAVSFKATVKTEALFKRLKKFKKSITYLNRYLKRGMQFYERHIIEKMLSGRVKVDYGLNRQTGTASKSWSIVSVPSGYLLWTSANYLIYHQLGGNVIPKRLYVYEEFKTVGRDLIIDNLKEGIRKAVIK